LCALSWGAKLIKPQIVFDRILSSDLSEKHTYHLLNEMSTSYPADTLEYVSHRSKKDDISQSTIQKLIQKMKRERSGKFPSTKSINPELSYDEITDLIAFYF